ncbi:hypothetical protein [Singapore grouper iridovirus]|nr:hypothetical protein [Singapore grouper iridovirus]
MTPKFTGSKISLLKTIMRLCCTLALMGLAAVIYIAAVANISYDIVYNATEPPYEYKLSTLHPARHLTPPVKFSRGDSLGG